MSTSTFRLIFVSAGIILAMGLSEIFKMELSKFVSVISFLVALDYIASGIIVRIIMSQNEDAVKSLIETLNKGKSDGRDDSKTE